MDHLRHEVELGNSEDNDSTHSEMMLELESMMRESSIEVFDMKLNEFRKTYARFDQFMNYFGTVYVDGDRYKRWTAAYHHKHSPTFMWKAGIISSKPDIFIEKGLAELIVLRIF
jgi:uncharacterized membrane protein